MTAEQIENIFTYHSPDKTQQESYQQIRQKAKELAFTIQALCPESREKSTALTNLQQAVMWANAAIAINKEPALAIPAGYHLVKIPKRGPDRKPRAKKAKEQPELPIEKGGSE